MTIIFLDWVKNPSDYFSMISKKYGNDFTFDLNDIFRTQFLLYLKKLSKLPVIFFIGRKLYLLWQVEILCLFVLQYTASA